ncbi:hypothetical protein OAF98_05440 [Planctomicrobium sp.]|jgi:hypothetical protein|nr:hypothetical protein [Planctomicrobium sp.]MBT5018888.1 hypothetical protein [Planctomicrobium sp.]MDB4731547.1 hypothetical protein [bacterium]MDB4743911.1 hypothetical protein [Planctomicrobium sp.]
MSEESRQLSESESPLNSWIEGVLFIVNLLIGAMGSVLIFRYGKIAWKTLEDFDVEIPKSTELVLSPIYACLLPILIVIAFAIHFLPIEQKKKVIAQGVTLLLMLVIAGLFVVTTVPVMLRLVESLVS